MFGNRARYDWLVDGQPTSLSFTEAGDVACGIEVSMEFEGAYLAFVDESVSVALTDIAASGAFLARISGIDIDDGLALPFGLVFDEPLELAEDPISELLQCYSIERLGQYPVSYLVVDIGHEAFFPFQHFGSIVPGSCDDGSGDVGIFFSDGVVCEMVELELIDNPILEARLEDIISSEIGRLDGLDQSVIGFDMQSDCPLHAIEPLAPSIDTYMGEDCKLLQLLPALKNGVSLEAIR